MNLFARKPLGLLVVVAVTCSTWVVQAVTITTHQYHLGEDDAGAVTGNPGADLTVDAVGGVDLARTGLPGYLTGAPVTGTTLGLDFANAYGPDANGAATEFYRDAAADLNPGDPANWGIETWVHFNTIPNPSVHGGQQEAGIVHAGTFAGGSLILQTLDDPGGSGNIVFAAHAPGSAIPAGITGIVPGAWNHVAAVVNSGTLELYVNGVLENSAGVGGLNPPAGLTIGAVNFAGTAGLNEGRGIDGEIDETRIFEFDAGAFDPATDLQLTNVFTDKPMTLEIDRQSGAITLANPPDNTQSFQILGYSIRSGIGAMNPADWTPIAGNYDTQSNGGDGSVDPVNPWTRLTHPNSRGDLSEAELAGGQGATIVPGKSIDLGTGAWIQSPTEDAQLEILLADGETPNSPVSYVGIPIPVGDLDFDGDIDADDWPFFRTDWKTDLTGLSVAESYQSGDLDGDGDSDMDDFGIFRTQFDGANGAGAFDAMIASVPEPTGMALSMSALLILCWRRGRRIVPVQRSCRPLALRTERLD